MMDVEKLIEKLQNAAGGPEGIKMCHDAATALSALQAENEKLQAELKEAEKKIDNLLDEEDKVAFYPFGVEKEG